MAELKKCSVLFKVEGCGDVAACVSVGESLLDAAKRAGLGLDAPCAGNGTCGKCRVQLVEGTVTGQANRHISPQEFSAGCRLACASVVASDCTVLVSRAALAWQDRITVSGMESERERDIFRSLQAELGAMGFEKDGGIELAAVTLAAPSPDDAAADRERLLREIAAQRNIDRRDIDFSLYALRRLPQALRKGGFSLTCVLRNEALRRQPGITILDVFPGGTKNTPAAAGLAVDIGTTTVEALLVDMLSGSILARGAAGNGQIRYGADVISRIMESVRPGGLDRLRSAVTEECIAPLIRAISGTVGLAPEQIYRVAVTGNTTMMHFFMGVTPEHLRLEPYVPAFFESGSLKSAELNLGVHPDAEVIAAPAAGSYVGGDITAGVFASMLFKKETLSLFVDLGTNGELVLGNSAFLVSCACSAGPAFEGGDISCGMRAADGAIEACRINRDTMEPELVVRGAVDQKPAGMCGSGLIDLVGELFRCGIINARGKFIREGERIRRDEWGAASYVAAFAKDSSIGRDILLTESDIDNFIRAKGAIFSAIRTMLAVVGFDEDAIGNVYVAGGIGGGINMRQAIAIGMLPNLPPEKYQYIGNSSLHGAFALLTSRKAGEMVAKIGSGMTYIELSSHPGYMDELVAACFLPHTNGALFENRSR